MVEPFDYFGHQEPDLHPDCHATMLEVNISANLSSGPQLTQVPNILTYCVHNKC